MTQENSMGPKSASLPMVRARRTVKDPVCAMDVDPERAAGSYEHAGETYFFCSQHCLDKFRAEPGAYLQGAAQNSSAAHGAVASTRPAPAAPAQEVRSDPRTEHTCPMHPEVRAVTQPPAPPPPCPECGMALEPVAIGAAAVRTEYVCPMHPEIVRDAPGACPICGMALEPRTVTLEDAPNPELVSMTRRFWASVALTAPILLLAMSEMLPRGGAMLLAGTRVWVEFVLATPVVLWGGWLFFERGWASI